MTRLLLTLVLLIILSSFQNFKEDVNTNSSATSYSLCATYTTKPPSELFYTRNQLTLNCDSTFKFISRNCLGTYKSFGKWTFRNTRIVLRSGKQIKKLVQQTAFTSSDKYIDLEKSLVEFVNDAIIFTRPGFAPDTLQIEQNFNKIR